MRTGPTLSSFDRGGSLSNSTAIVIQSLDKIPAVIDTLITAVRNGELDEQLAATKKSMPAKSRKAV